MNEQGLWKLFFATGSPLVWLAIRRPEGEQEQAVPAFWENDPETAEL